MTSAGARLENSLKIRIGLIGSASTVRLGVHHLPPVADLLTDVVLPGPVALALQQRDEAAQGRGRVADEVDLVGVPHPDLGAVDVDLDGAGLVELGHELGVGEAGPDGQQGVAAHHHLVAGAGAEQPDGPGHVGQLVGEDVLAEQRLGDTRAEQFGDLGDLVRGAAGALADEDRRPSPRR